MRWFESACPDHNAQCRVAELRLTANSGSLSRQMRAVSVRRDPTDVHQEHLRYAVAWSDDAAPHA